jgi:uncharacterized protein YciI
MGPTDQYARSVSANARRRNLWRASKIVAGRGGACGASVNMIGRQGRFSMLYAIVGTDVPDSLAKRAAARPAHLARLEALRDEGRLVLAGPFPAIDANDPGPAGFSGSLIVAEFADLGAAQAWADADPYIEAGVYASVSVRPFRRVLP